MTAKVILNPYAGRWKALKSLYLIKSELSNAGVDHELVVTECPGHGTELAAEAVRAGFSPIISAGGDGSISEVVNGIVRETLSKESTQPIPLGILPLGSANDLVVNLKLPITLPERLKEIHARWKKEQKWPESLPVKVKGTAVKDILKDFLLKAEASAPGNDDDLKAVRTALDFEAKGEKFYAQLRDASTDPKEKAFFEILSKMERQHYLSLKDTEDYFTDPEGWFRKKEHHGVDGA